MRLVEHANDFRVATFPQSGIIVNGLDVLVTGVVQYFPLMDCTSVFLALGFVKFLFMVGVRYHFSHQPAKGK